MKQLNYNIYTEKSRSEIIYEIRNANHIGKSILKTKMFSEIIQNDIGDLTFKPNFGPVNLMIIHWKYKISFKDLDKGYFKLKVERKFCIFSILFFVLMYTIVMGVLITFIKNNNIGLMGNIVFIGFSMFIILSSALNYFSVRFNQKQIINLFPNLVNGEIERIK